METTHTPGPWESFYNEEGTQTISAGQNQELIIAEVFPTQGDNDDSEANARLIAAAPELKTALAAHDFRLKKCVAVLQRNIVPDGISDKDAISELLGLLDNAEFLVELYAAEVAIAKAEGKY